MDYEEAMTYIHSAAGRGIMPGLDRIRGLLEQLEHPERACYVIHVAGTNGKGSVCAYMDAILRQAGYRTGRYISPAVYGYRERIQVDGEWIPEKALADGMTRVREADARLQAEGLPGASAFELETALAFWFFRERACDFAVVETGMGGRLDATNVVPQPVLSVITAIGMDHRQYLGDTIEAIAAEKGGIIREGRPVVLAAGRPEAERVLQDICRERHSAWVRVRTETLTVSQASLEGGQTFDYGRYKGLHTRLPGSYQPGNAAAAVEAMGLLSAMGPEDLPEGITPPGRLPSECLTPEIVAAGIEKAVWPGRFEVLLKHPLVIVDGAHNPDGVQALAASVQRYLPDRRRILVMGVFADKDYEQMLRLAAPLSDRLIAFRPDSERGLDAHRLLQAANDWFACAEAAGSQREALERALALCEPEDAVVCLGSLSTVAGLNRILGEWVHEED